MNPWKVALLGALAAAALSSCQQSEYSSETFTDTEIEFLEAINAGHETYTSIQYAEFLCYTTGVSNDRDVVPPSHSRNLERKIPQIERHYEIICEDMK